MSRSTKRPYLHYAGFKHKAQRAFRNLSRRLIRRKGKSAIKECMKEHDLESADYVYREGTSFKDGFNEWALPSDGHQVYVKSEKKRLRK